MSSSQRRPLLEAVGDSPEKQVEVSRREKPLCQIVDRLTDVGQQLIFCQVSAVPPQRLDEGLCVTASEA